MPSTRKSNKKLPHVRDLLVDDQGRVLQTALNRRAILEEKEVDPVLTTQICWCGTAHSYGAFCARPGEKDRAHPQFCEEE